MARTRNEGPTPRAEWVKPGDACRSPSGVQGEVLRVTKTSSLPYATVRWENGHTGRLTITQLRRVARGA